MPDTDPSPSSQPAAQAKAHDSPQLTPAELRSIVLGVMLALFLSALDQTIVATALPAIGADLGNFELIGWVVTAYLLTSTCATPILGKLSDLHGRRLIMRLCILIFLASSVLAALSESMIMLILARALQGVGGGGLITMAQAVIADVISPRERGRYSAYFSAVWAASALLGPTLGGLLTQFLSWHWIFWINLPIGLLALGITDRILRRLTPHRAQARIDYLSIGLFTVSVTLFLLILSLADVTFPWLSPEVVVSALVSVVCGFIFLWRQNRAAEPIIPPRFLTDRVVAPVLLSIFLIFGGYLAVAVMAPTYFQVAGQSPVSEVGLLMIPLMVSGTVTAALGGRYVSKTGKYKLPPLIGLPISVVALLVLAALADQVSPLTASLLLMVMGFGIGPIFPIVMVAAQNAVARRDLGAVSGSIGLARALGAAVATAAGSALVLKLIMAGLPETGHLSSLEDLLRHPLTDQGRAEVAHAFSVLFLVVAGWLAVGWLAFLRVQARPLEHKPRLKETSPL